MDSSALKSNQSIMHAVMEPRALKSNYGNHHMKHTWHDTDTYIMSITKCCVFKKHKHKHGDTPNLMSVCTW